MTWTSTTQEQLEVARGVVLWITTAREVGYGGPNWLPSDTDVYKSALFERIRSGKEPLEEAPPRGMSCPWYALIEDKGPHYVFDVWRGDHSFGFTKATMVILQHPYTIVQERGDDFILKDSVRESSYRFRLWFDENYRGHPIGMIQRGPAGGWFIQNVALASV